MPVRSGSTVLVTQPTLARSNDRGGALSVNLSGLRPDDPRHCAIADPDMAGRAQAALDPSSAAGTQAEIGWTQAGLEGVALLAAVAVAMTNGAPSLPS